MHTLPSNAHLRNPDFASAALPHSPALAIRRDALTAQILGAGLPPASERLALRLLYAGGLQSRMSWPHFLAFCGCHHQGAARRHLTRLKEAALITYETAAAAVCIRFSGEPCAGEGEPRAVEGAPQRSAPPQPVRAAGGASPLDGDPSPPAVRAVAGAPELLAARAVEGASPLGAERPTLPAPYTRARGRGGWLVVDPNPNPISMTRDLPTNHHNQSRARAGAKGQKAALIAHRQTPASLPTSPSAPGDKPLHAEAEHTYQMLLAAGIANCGVARRLAASHPFSRVRDCVAKYHLGQDQFHSPGIIVTWLDQPHTFAVDPMPFAFRQSALYREHCRLPAEIAAEEAAEAAARCAWAEQEATQRLAQRQPSAEQRQQAALQTQLEQERAAASAALPAEVLTAWRQLLVELAAQFPTFSFNRYIQPAFLAAASAEMVPEMVEVVLPSPEALAWAEIYLRPQIRRRLGSMLRCRGLEVRFRLVEGDRMTG